MDECIEEYVALSQKVFDVDLVLKGNVPRGDDRCRFDYNKLESAIKSLVKGKLNEENFSLADSGEITGTVPTFVVATKGRHADGPATLFRSYQCTGHNVSKCCIWEAARATSAGPAFFKPIAISEIPSTVMTYVDGGLSGYNNPAELAIFEARKLWAKSHRICLVSIGAGRPKAVKLIDLNARPDCGSTKSKIEKMIPNITKDGGTPSDSGVEALEKMGLLCLDLVMNSEPAHQRVLKESVSTQLQKRFPYHRFNVEREMQDIGFEEWNRVEEITSHTTVYLEEWEGMMKKNACVHDLLEPPNTDCNSPIDLSN